MKTFKILFFSMIVLTNSIGFAQDLSGTWEGHLFTGRISYDNRRPSIVTGTGLSSGGGTGLNGDIGGATNNSRMVWELVQIGNKLSGIVYFYAPDTKPGDKPNSWYTWEGRLPKDSAHAFLFIQGRYIDGLGEMPVYQFNVHHQTDSVALVLKGSWFKSLETLNTMEKPSGYFDMHKVKGGLADPLWSKWKDKSIREKALSLL